MSKIEIKELIAMIIIAVIDIVLAFSITTYLGIANIVILKTFTFTYGDITWEVVIFLLLFSIGGFMCEKNFAKNKYNEKSKIMKI